MGLNGINLSQGLTQLEEMKTPAASASPTRSGAKGLVKEMKNLKLLWLDDTKVVGGRGAGTELLEAASDAHHHACVNYSVRALRGMVRSGR